MPLPHWQPPSPLCIKPAERPLPGLKFVPLTKLSLTKLRLTINQMKVNALILQLHKVYSCFVYFRSQGADRKALTNQTLL